MISRPDTLRIVQLNIGSLIEPEWDRRRHEIIAWIERLEPDVLCFQEAWEDSGHPNSVAWLVEQLNDRLGIEWHWCFGGFSLPPQLYPDPTLLFGSAILSRWPIEEHTLHPLPVDDHPDPWRRLQMELLHARTAGLDIFSTHLVPAPDHAYHRVAQVVALDEIVKANTRIEAAPGLHGKRAGMPSIVCGDFNAEPDSDEMRYLTSLAVIGGRSVFYQDAWRVAGDGGVGHTQDWRRNPLADSMNVHRKRIDYVLVGDPFLRLDNAGRVQHAAIVFDEPLTGILASDHFGLAVDVHWPTRPDTDQTQRG